MDPLTGVYAALAVIDAMAQGESGLLDFPMVAVAGRCRQKIARAGRHYLPAAGNENMLIKNARIDDHWADCVSI